VGSGGRGSRALIYVKKREGIHRKPNLEPNPKKMQRRKGKKGGQKEEELLQALIADKRKRNQAIIKLSQKEGRERINNQECL